jgi:cytochrome c5
MTRIATGTVNCPRIAALLIGLVAIAACSPDAAQSLKPSPADATHEENVGSVQGDTLGGEVYASSCAVCHDDGIGGAPATGDQAAWSQRSRLWTAVLSEHAKRGYLNMPTKGGDPTLSDASVAAASEYIMSQTYPELPPSD